MGNILVADDDPDFVEIIRAILMSDGHQVVTAAGGDEAMVCMRKDKPDLLLLDMMMSHVLDGLDVMRKMWLNPSLRGIPVMIVSSLTAMEEASMFSSAEHVQVAGWISKPVRPDVLRVRVRQLLAGASDPDAP
jgi:CheY-like chemotaxis protein